MLACLYCSKDTLVLETRTQSNYIRRRRICSNTECNQRTTTMEARYGGRHRDGDMYLISTGDIKIILRALKATQDALAVMTTFMAGVGINAGVEEVTCTHCEGTIDNKAIIMGSARYCSEECVARAVSLT